MKLKLLVLISLLMIICHSCNNSGDKFIGNWKGDYKNLSIIKAGDAYTINIIYPNAINNVTLTGTYENGNLKANGGFTTFSYSDGKIIFEGKEFLKE